MWLVIDLGVFELFKGSNYWLCMIFFSSLLLSSISHPEEPFWFLDLFKFVTMLQLCEIVLFIYKIHFCEVLLTPSDLVCGFWLFLVIVQVTNMVPIRSTHLVSHGLSGSI